ncbi:MAG TPA: hypothetical protein VGH89_02395 [Pseudonocardia sp.]|jgi:hypothetical protein
MGITFDAGQTWSSFEQFRDRASTPRQAQILQTVIDHSRAEVGGDLDGIMVTLVDEPRFHDHGVYPGVVEDTGPKGRRAVVDNYQAMVDNGSYVIESRKERVIIDDDRLVTEGSFRQILTAPVARAMGFVNTDATGFFLVHARTVVFWEFDQAGKAHGEDRYVFVQSVEPLAKEDLPDNYPQRLLAAG